jgi:hypothetical protein
MSGRLRIKHDAGKAIFCRWRIRGEGIESFVAHACDGRGRNTLDSTRAGGEIIGN